MPAQEQFANDANYWWLRFVFAIREGRLNDATKAQERLRNLGINVELTSIDSLLVGARHDR